MPLVAGLIHGTSPRTPGSVAAALVGWLGLLGSTCAAAERITFGTDVHGKPITWSMVLPSDPTAASAEVDEQGRLHLKFAAENEAQASDVIELHAADPHSFGTFEYRTPWIEWS